MTPEEIARQVQLSLEGAPYIDDDIKRIAAAIRQTIELAKWPTELERGKFFFGDRVRTKRGTWQGHICGFYTAPLTPIGYAVRSEREKKSVQIYSESALELVPNEESSDVLPNSHETVTIPKDSSRYPLPHAGNSDSHSA